MKALRKLFGRSTPSPRPSVKPSLENLEDRTALSTVAAAPDGSLFAIWGSDRGVYQYFHYPQYSGWSNEITNNATQVAVGADGALDVAFTNGSVKQAYLSGAWGWSGLIFSTVHSPSQTWTMTASGYYVPTTAQVDALAAGSHGEVYYSLGNSKLLYMHDATGEHYLNDWNVADLSVGGYGQLYKVYNNGSLYRADANNDSSTNTLLFGSGVHHIAGGSGWNYYMIWGSDNEVWGNINGSFNGNYYGNNAAQLSADFNGGIDYVDTSSYLHHAGDYDEGFGNGFWTY
jgi:hypothetical protein